MAEITHIDNKRDSTKGLRTDIVNCLLIPLVNGMVLLPNTAIAEVVGYQEPESGDSGPEWFLGMLNWRDYRVPVISFESAIGGQVSTATSDSRIAVLNTLNGNSKVPYIGFLSQGIPHLRLVNDSSILPDNEVSVPAASVASYARLEEEAVMIPDIDDIENRLLNLMQA